MKSVIEVNALVKDFGTLRAVDHLTFSVQEGTLFAFLGENGAGKSTAISILCGVEKATEGRAFINGKEVGKGNMEEKCALGVVFQNSVLDSALSAYDNLLSRAALYGITGKAFQERLEELTDLLDFREFLHRPVGKCSGGQRRRIDIARALFHKPRILILDEPTTGLDPQTRRLLWDVIENLQKKEKLTVFLTTHYMEEAAMADDVVILEQGKIAAHGTPLELKNRYTGDFIFLYGVTRQEAEALGKPLEEIPQGYRVTVENTQVATELIQKHPEIFRDYEITKGKMDDVFLAVTGKSGKGEEL